MISVNTVDGAPPDSPDSTPKSARDPMLVPDGRVAIVLRPAAVHPPIDIALLVVAETRGWQ
jgi:hypothetical protein